MWNSKSVDSHKNALLVVSWRRDLGWVAVVVVVLIIKCKAHAIGRGRFNDLMLLVESVMTSSSKMSSGAHGEHVRADDVIAQMTSVLADLGLYSTLMICMLSRRPNIPPSGGRLITVPGIPIAMWRDRRVWAKHGNAVEKLVLEFIVRDTWMSWWQISYKIYTADTVRDFCLFLNRQTENAFKLSKPYRVAPFWYHFELFWMRFCNKKTHFLNSCTKNWCILHFFGVRYIYIYLFLPLLEFSWIACMYSDK